MRSRFPDSPMTFAQFRRLDVRAWSRSLRDADPLALEKAGRRLAARVQAVAAGSVPAYRHFLQQHGIDPDKADRVDLSSLPITEKSNYLRKFALNELAPGGSLDATTVVSVSSGSTGEPFLWPRCESLEAETAALYELGLAELLGCDGTPTLCVVGYALGAYVAGIFTSTALGHLQGKGLPLTLVTPGLDRDAAVSLMTRLAPQFRRVVIGGYPPVLKAYVEAVAETLREHDIQLAFFSGGEPFSERFRDYVLDLGGSGSHWRHTFNTYGSADAAILGHETPASIQVRRWASADGALCRDLFGDERLPSLQAYHPYLKHFEAEDGRLLFTTFGGIPLVRYAIGDLGGVLRYDQVVSVCRDHGYDLPQALRAEGCELRDWKLPLVFLHGRGDNTVFYLGANVYADPIRELLNEPQWLPRLSGRFRMEVEHDAALDPVLRVHVELAPGLRGLDGEATDGLAAAIDQRLQATNSEYRELRRTMARPPLLALWEHEHPEHFPRRIKSPPVR